MKRAALIALVAALCALAAACVRDVELGPPLPDASFSIPPDGGTPPDGLDGSLTLPDAP